MTKIDPRELRNAFGAFMTGVTVVTTEDGEGAPLGFTANSFSSVSLDPPLVTVCLARSSRNFEAFSRINGFAVNVLSETQKDISNTVAKPVEDRFSAASWQKGPEGSPVFEGVSAWFDCSTFKAVDAGDHFVLIGKVEAFENTTRPGLGYARGAYVTPAAEAEALGNAANLWVSALIELYGKVLLVEDSRGLLQLPKCKVSKQGAALALDTLITSSGAEAESGFIYSVYEDNERKTQHISFLCQASSEAASVGAFIDISAQTLARIADPAHRTMLARFASENRVGDFGVYYGNRTSGKVRPLSTRT